MVSRFMAATRHLHAGSAPGAAWVGREHKAPRAQRPRPGRLGAGPRKRAELQGRFRRGGSEQEEAVAGSDVEAAAVKDLKTRHATAAPRRAPLPSYAGAGLAQAPPAPPRAPRAPPLEWWPRPRRAGSPGLRTLLSGVLLEFRRRSADLPSVGQPGRWTRLASEASPHGRRHLLGWLGPRPCSRLATRYSS